jgi:hypothetical protein
MWAQLAGMRRKPGWGVSRAEMKIGGKNLFTSYHKSQIHALLDKFSIKNYFISKIRRKKNTCGSGFISRKN